MFKFKKAKLIILPILLIVTSCRNTSSSENSVFSSEDTTSLVESSTDSTTEESSDLVTESSDITLESSEPVTEESSDEISDIPSDTSEEPVSSSEDSVSSSDESSEIISSSEQEPEPEPEPEPDPEPEPEPGIYLDQTRIGVAKGHTTTISHHVYPANLGEVTWEIIPLDEWDDPANYAVITPGGEVTGIQYRSEEYQIKGTLLDFEVYLTLMIFLDYDKHVDTFYPSYQIEDAIGRGNRYHNGTTMYAGISPLRNVHYYAYDLKAGMTFNVMGLTRYSYDRPKFYYEFGRAVNNKFVVLQSPFISDDGKAMLLGYDVTEDGEYMVRVKPHIEINTSSDGFSYIKYTFWF